MHGVVTPRIRVAAAALAFVRRAHRAVGGMGPPFSARAWWRAFTEEVITKAWRRPPREGAGAQPAAARWRQFTPFSKLPIGYAATGAHRARRSAGPTGSAKGSGLAPRSCTSSRCAGSFRHRSPIKYSIFPFKLSESGADISKRIVLLQSLRWRPPGSAGGSAASAGRTRLAGGGERAPAAGGARRRR